MIILKLILEKEDGLDSSSGKGPVAGSCEHGNKLPGLTKVEEFLD